MPGLFLSIRSHLGIFPLGNTPQELDAWMRKEIARWKEIATATDLKAD
jgi:tripartite-type tricarboxylate transporter receptor subunit TctC